MVIEVRDSEFAAAIMAIGVPFADPNKPFTLLERADGSRMVFWRFADKTTDGKVKTQSLLRAQKDPIAWIADNPQHPFCFALCGIINARRFREAEATGRPLVGFHLKGNRKIFVFSGSRKHRKLIAMGAVQL